jgi:hypothetical protein
MPLDRWGTGKMKKQRERLKDREGVNKESSNMYMCIWRWVGLVSVPGTAIVVQCSIVFNTPLVFFSSIVPSWACDVNPWGQIEIVNTLNLI